MSLGIHGVVLAAGASRRAGGPKALAIHRGRTFVEHAVTTLEAGGCARVAVVLAAPHGARVERVLPRAEVIWNPEPERGQLSSLRCALRATEARAVVVSLVDHPRVSPRTVRALLDVHRATGAWVVRPRFAGRRGHPLLLDRVLFERICAEPGSDGLRGILRSLPARHEHAVDVPDPAIHDDVDTQGQVAAIGATLATA
ncbi:MAG: nucleotidyltransferase family protein [Deltaproteobacteria bacterium]|nr:nucleotidyltransferase family protein [Deltaproteobacteria bacterium]